MRAILPLLLLASCATHPWREAPHDRYFQRATAATPHSPIEAQPSSEWWSSLVHTTIRPATEAISPGYWIKTVIGGTPALDINAFGQVLDSSWYENRVSRGQLDAAAVRHGANQLDGGPAPGPLLVIGGKVEGATPGLVVEDSAGDVFIIKFDPPAVPESSSGAEAIASRLLWAAGYNVPENYVVTFDLSRLVLSERATTRTHYGATIALTLKAMNDIVALVNPYQDGRVRALFSRKLPGRAAGHFAYRGLREEDPNDRVPHERRRSLRALWMFNAWINNTDTTSANTFDAFVESESGLGTLRHFLLDFGDSLGASGVRQKHASQGYEGMLDWRAIGQQIVTAGLHYPYWLPVKRSPFRSIGIFEADVFEPERWKTSVPNPAFDASTALDDYWAASVLARMTPGHIAAAVDAAEYSEPGAREWMLRVLIERQYKLLILGFSRVLALSDPVVESSLLSMTDLEVFTMCLDADQAPRYVFEVRWNREHAFDEPLDEGTRELPTVDLSQALVALERRAAGTEERFVTVRWKRMIGEEESPFVDVHLRVIGNRLVPVGIDRSTR